MDKEAKAGSVVWVTFYKEAVGGDEWLLCILVPKLWGIDFALPGRLN
jgi:hypothetical protein